jgi:hypothetical protein
VALVSLLPPLVEAAEENVRWHHVVHAGMILSGAALAFAAAGVPRVWARIGRLGDTAVVLVILAPVVAMLAMTPRYYEAVEDSALLHLGYHLVFFFGLGAITGLAAAALGRVAGWTLLVLSCGMGVLYAAGVLGS